MPASGAAFVTGRRFFLPLMHGVLNWIGESDLGETTGGATYARCPELVASLNCTSSFLWS